MEEKEGVEMVGEGGCGDGEEGVEVEGGCGGSGRVM